MLLTGERRGQPDVPGVVLPQAHFLERQFIHHRWDWERGTHEVATLLPGVADHLPPASHRPGAQPAGNGPFYVPEWALGQPETPTHRDATRVLLRLGFRRFVAHVCYVSSGPDFLATVLRLAHRHRWTAPPLTGRLYLYPGLPGGARKGLRDVVPSLPSERQFTDAPE